MKKLKKLLSAVLTVAMVMSLMSMTVFAYPTIDTTQKGSLTIHKYEYNDTPQNSGTGASTDTVPNDATPLDGVTFRITKVADLSDYYGIDGEKLMDLDDAQALVKPTSNSNNFSNVGDWITVETATDGDKQGQAKIQNMPLGLYLVEEISAPAQITGKADPFLVSIPMTDVEEDDWLYDVHVYPKNRSTYSGVTLKKEGKFGDDDAVALSGATFVLQKKNTSDEWETVIQNSKNQKIGADDGTLTTASSTGQITVSNLAPGKYRFIETGVPVDTGYIMDGKNVHEFTIADGITQKDSGGNAYPAGTVLVNDVKIENAPHITVTNYKPDVEKMVQDRTATTTSWVEASDYSAGDIVPYRIKVDVPANVDELRAFTLSDTMEHQSYVADSLKIYSDEDLSNQILNDCPVDTSDDTVAWKIEFNSTSNGAIVSKLSSYKGSSIYIYFEATLGADAITTSEGNDNTVTLKYSNKIVPTKANGTSTDPQNPNEAEDPSNSNDDPEKDIITDQATVYTFQIAVEKVNSSNTNIKLSGVKFDLYREDSTGTIDYKTIKGLPSDKKFVKVNDDGSAQTVDDSLITDENGTITVNGLEKGTYYLVETKTNNGYNLLKAPVLVEITATYTAETQTIINAAAGVTTTTKTVSNTAFTAGNDGTSGIYKTIIKNSKGFELPQTGGMGTFLFSIVGAILMIGGGFILLRSYKKKSA